MTCHDANGKGRRFHPAPAPSQEDIENLVEKVSKWIFRFLERRGVIILVAAQGDGEVTVVTDASTSSGHGLAYHPFLWCAFLARGFAQRRSPIDAIARRCAGRRWPREAKGQVQVHKVV
jgi:hypothetical protein